MSPLAPRSALRSQVSRAISYRLRGTGELPALGVPEDVDVIEDGFDDFQARASSRQRASLLREQ